MTPVIEESDIEAGILHLTEASRPGASICPSDVARALSPDWRPLLGRVRRVAARLAEAGRIEILRKGKPVPPAQMRGVIRLRRRGEAP
jgi:hypothetical protein